MRERVFVANPEVGQPFYFEVENNLFDDNNNGRLVIDIDNIEVHTFKPIMRTKEKIHNHPDMERKLGVDKDHVIIDRHIYEDLLQSTIIKRNTVDEGNIANLLYVIAVILIIAWIIGFFFFKPNNPLIHVLLVIATMAILLRIINGK
jgi:hypothetical protein